MGAGVHEKAGIGAMRCTACALENVVGAKFCGRCGVAMEAIGLSEAPPLPGTAALPSTPGLPGTAMVPALPPQVGGGELLRHRSSNRLIWIGCAALAVVAFAVVAFVVFGGGEGGDGGDVLPGDSRPDLDASSDPSAVVTTAITQVDPLATVVPGLSTLPTVAAPPNDTATVVAVTAPPIAATAATVAPLATIAPVTVAPIATVAAGTTQTTPPPRPAAAAAALDGDLGLTKPITRPACDGTYITLVGGAVTADKYAAHVQATLDQYPGSNYLRAELVCSSLRPRTQGGTAIYVTYFGPFTSVRDACAARARGPADAYVKILDNLADPATAVDC